MEEYQTKVIDWIERNYDTTQITIKDHPQGKMVCLRNGKKIIVCWDFIKNTISTKTEE